MYVDLLPEVNMLLKMYSTAPAALGEQGTWRSRGLHRATNSGFLSGLQGMCICWKLPSEPEDHSGTRATELSEKVLMAAGEQFRC